MNLKILAIFFLVLTSTCVQGQINPVQNQLPHEAFLISSEGALVLTTAPARPPALLREDIPPQIDANVQWIRGYWAWSQEKNAFFWISGIWRKPPPGRQWIYGQWKYFEEGWVWIPGFWSEQPYDKLNFIEEPPPDPLDENPGLPPSDHHFWLSGYWNYVQDSHQFEWYAGQWQPFVHNWVLIPAQYLWQPDGFLFVPSYWDWPLNQVGRAYEPVEIVKQSLTESYQPRFMIKFEVILQRYFLYYPDYLPYFNHYFHFQPNFWKLFLNTPPWWSWTPWWAFTRYQQWALWWWYTHPGYPQPHWLISDLTKFIPPPTTSLQTALQKIKNPLIVTPNGVVSTGVILGVLDEFNRRGKEYTEQLNPIVPGDPDLLAEFKASILPKALPKNNILMPSGTYGNLKKISSTEILKPFNLLAKNLRQINFKLANSPQKLPAIPKIVPEVEKTKDFKGKKGI